MSRSPRATLVVAKNKNRRGSHRLKFSNTLPLRLAVIGVAVLIALPARAACDFAPVKQQIDTVLDRDAAKGAKFRKEVSEGADSITMIEKLVTEDMAEKVDICRFEAGEYLTKRGYPPFH